MKVELLEEVSAFPMTIEFAVGVNGATEREVDPVEELPEEDITPLVEVPASS